MPGAMACRLKTLLLYDPSDMAWLRRCLEEKPAGQQRDIELHKLNAMGAFERDGGFRRGANLSPSGVT